MTTKDKRVLQLTDSTAFAGTERLILDLSVELINGGWHSQVGCPCVSPLADRCRLENVSLFDVQRTEGRRVFSDWSNVRSLKSLISEGKTGLIHIHNGRSALVACLAGGGRLVPMVMSQHFLRPARTTRTGVKAIVSGVLHKWISKRITRHIAISGAVSQAAVAQNIAPQAKLSVVHNGIRDPLSDISEVSERIAVLCAARAEPEKDIPTLVRAISIVAQSRTDVQCYIAGDGRDLAAIQSLIDSLDLGERVKLLGFRRDVRELMAACSIFVLPAIAEPFGLVLLEAMALGKPVIACNYGGPCEIVQHDHTGLLVTPGSVTELADSILALQNSPARRMELGRSARTRYEQLFTARAMANRMICVYEQAQSEWRRKRPDAEMHK